MPRRPLRGARAAAVLGWCSPQSSVPRQTVGHHARAAVYEMGQKAACEGCRGEVPGANPTTPPQSTWGLSFSYTHRPGRSGAHGPAGSGVDFPIPQNSFVWVSLEIGSRARTQRTSLVATDQDPRPEPANAAPGSEPAQHVQCGAASCPAACLACSFLIYPPTRAQWAARPGGLWGGFPNPAKLICMGFARNRLASSHTAKMAGRAPRGLAQQPHARGRASAPPWGRARAPQPAYPIPQPAYPIPPLPRHPPRYQATYLASNTTSTWFI
jgi:hypothetical protein